MILAEPTCKIPRREKTSLRLGVRAHDFGRLPADELAARIAARGFSCVQLALNKAIAGLNLQAGDLNAELAREIGGAFARHGVGIEVLGCYINPIHPDLQTRAEAAGIFQGSFAVCPRFWLRHRGLGKRFGERGLFAASGESRRSGVSEMLASISELVAVAEKFGVTVGFEAVRCHTVSTPQKMRRVLDTIGSNNLRVVFDAVNLLSAENFREQSRIIAEALDLLGDRHRGGSRERFCF